MTSSPSITAARWCITATAFGVPSEVVVSGPESGRPDGILPVIAEVEEALDTRSGGLAAFNRRSAATERVSDVLLRSVDRAAIAHRETAGWFDPTVGQVGSGPAVGPDGLRVDPWRGAITLPLGRSLDLGGIARSITADRLAEAAVQEGARGAAARVGDVTAVAGEPPPTGWECPLVDPYAPGRPLGVVRLARGALATVTTRGGIAAPEWPTDRPLVDPHTGAPAGSGVATAIVHAASATSAEAMALAAVVAGRHSACALLEAAGMTGLLVLDDGTLVHAGLDVVVEVP